MTTAKVLEVISEPRKITSGYSVKVKAVTVSWPEGKTFEYEFIKNHKSDADEIITDFTFEMKCRRKWL